jgi:hypothetical protein
MEGLEDDLQEKVARKKYEEGEAAGRTRQGLKNAPLPGTVKPPATAKLR